MLAARVPAAIRDAGVLRNVVQGTFAPHTIQKEDKSLDDATSDFAKAVALPFFIMRSFRARCCAAKVSTAARLSGSFPGAPKRIRLNRIVERILEWHQYCE